MKTSSTSTGGKKPVTQPANQVPDPSAPATCPTCDQLRAECQRLAAVHDETRDRYVLVPRALWDIIDTWPVVLNRARQVAGFLVSVGVGQGLVDAQGMWEQVVK